MRNQRIHDLLLRLAHLEMRKVAMFPKGTKLYAPHPSKMTIVEGVVEKVGPQTTEILFEVDGQEMRVKFKNRTREPVGPNPFAGFSTDQWYAKRILWIRDVKGKIAESLGNAREEALTSSLHELYVLGNAVGLALPKPP